MAWLEREDRTHWHRPNLQVDTLGNFEAGLREAGRTINRTAVDDVGKMAMHPNIYLFQRAWVLAGPDLGHRDVGEPAAGTKNASHFTEWEHNFIRRKELQGEAAVNRVETAIGERQFSSVSN